MPYIKQEDRNLTNIFSPRTSGELNFAFTEIILNFLGSTPNYQKFNDVLGALEGAKLELYRRRISDYEDRKIVENGDVFIR